MILLAETFTGSRVTDVAEERQDSAATELLKPGIDVGPRFGGDNCHCSRGGIDMVSNALVDFASFGKVTERDGLSIQVGEYLMC